MSTTTNYQHIRTRSDRGAIVLTAINSSLRGDEYCEGWKQEMVDAVERAKADKVVVDLQYVTFASSRALGVLAGFHRDIVKVGGGKMALCGLTPLVREAMAVVRFINEGASAPLVEPSDTAEPSTNRSLFQIVTDNELAAVEALLKV